MIKRQFCKFLADILQKLGLQRSSLDILFNLNTSLLKQLLFFFELLNHGVSVILWSKCRLANFIASKTFVRLKCECSKIAGTFLPTRLLTLKWKNLKFILLATVIFVRMKWLQSLSSYDVLKNLNIQTI